MYRDHFGLDELPFSVTPDPRFIYNSAIYDDVLGRLRYGIEAKKGFIVVSGEAGTGKTTLLRRLMRGFTDRVVYAYIFNPRLKFTSLLRALLKDLGVRATAADKESMLEQINEYVLQQHKHGRIVTWIFDEAQGLSDEVLEELRLLGNLETDSEKLIQIILVGQPELESRLDRPKLAQLKQRIGQRHVLHPLGSGEVGPYLTARLDQAGYRGEDLFDDYAVQMIAGYSRGIPRLINSLCDNALVRACQAGARTIAPEIIGDAAKELRLDGSFQLAPNMLLEKVDDGNELANSGAPLVVDTGSRDYDLATAGNFGRPLRSETIHRPGRAALATNARQLRLAVGALIAVVVLAWGLAVSWPPRSEVAVSHVNPPETLVRKVVPDSEMKPAPMVPVADQSATPQLLPQESIVAHTEARETPEPPPQPVELPKEAPPPARKVFRVSEASFLRNRPAANADIVDTLHPGMRVEVTGLGGEFLRVRSVGGESFQGFVHKEDAFFEPVR